MNRLLISKLKNISFTPLFKRYASDCFYKEDYTIDPFCSVFITTPFNLKIRPLDVHAYPNCDKIIISLFSNYNKPKAKVICLEDTGKFNVFGEASDKGNYDCIIEAPIKSNIYAIAHQKGTIDIKKFNGDQIILNTEVGEIVADSCQNSKIDIRSSRGGSITTLGTLQAAEIFIQSKNKAKIDVNHLQALKATIISDNGDIKIKSSYCDDTIIKTKTGKLNLDNIHKKCSVDISENGLLHMTGFDGTLNAKLMEGNADIQASKLYDQSIIEHHKKGSILLRVSEWIQNNTKIKTNCQQLKVSDHVILSMKNENNYVVLTPRDSTFTSELRIDSKLSKIDIQGASWSDMLKLKGIKFSE